MICTNGLFTSDQWEVFNKYDIQVPIEGEHYTVRQVLNTRRGKSYLLNEIHNPMIPAGLDSMENDFMFEPNWSAFRFKQENEYTEDVLALTNVA